MLLSPRGPQIATSATAHAHKKVRDDLHKKKPIPLNQLCSKVVTDQAGSKQVKQRDDRNKYYRFGWDVWESESEGQSRYQTEKKKAGRPGQTLVNRRTDDRESQDGLEAVPSDCQLNQ